MVSTLSRWLLRHTAIVALAGAALAADRAAAQDTLQVPASFEVRGIEILSNGPGFRSLEEVDATLAVLKESGLNQIMPLVRTPLGLAYRSTIERSLPDVPETGESPIENMRSRLSANMSFVPWVETMPAHNELLGAPLPQSPLGLVPGLACLNSTGGRAAARNEVFLDPGHPGTREYLLAVLVEMKRRLAPDGVVLDGFEYPGVEWGYSPGAIERFRAEVGGEGPPPPNDPTWTAWRRTQLRDTLASIRSRLVPAGDPFTLAVVIDAVGPAPQSWADYTASRAYSVGMQDWIGWAQEGLVDQVILRYHTRHDPQTMGAIDAWLRFAHNNTGNARVVFSLAGNENYSENLNLQIRTIRSMGVGTSIHHFASPTRDGRAGFYSSLSANIFNSLPGQPLPRVPMDPAGRPQELRTFTRMDPPPPSLSMAPTPQPTVPPRIILSTPPPPPTPSPVPVIRPEQTVRTLLLASGREIIAKILEIRPDTYVILTSEGIEMEIQRSMVESIAPPLQE
jgi:uncharacterized lipoprotein YddW (UPF0748 family)